MKLKDEIASRAKEIRTDGYAMSIGEVISLYRDNEIDIHPEFQRIFRWDDDQKSRLVESILLGIPIPPIFVSQRHDGVWDVIDGVQRLSTILEFVGEYRDEAENKADPSTLMSGEYLRDLDGYSWGKNTVPTSAAGDDGKKIFDEALRRDFKRAKLEFKIINKESDANAKYDLFQRLNSGSILSPQEIRNCLLVMLNKSMYEQVVNLAKNDDFLSTVQLSERQEEQAYREELVLRFFVQVEFSGDLTELAAAYGEYTTTWMRDKANDGGFVPSDLELFTSAFELLNAALGDETFRRFDGDRHLGPFSISGYEFITTGVSANLSSWQSKEVELAERIRSVWSAEDFTSNSGTGISPRRRVPRMVNYSRDFFRD